MTKKNVTKVVKK